MRECEFFIQTSRGKLDCRGHEVTAEINGKTVRITRKGQLARLEREHGELDLMVDGESVKSKEGRHSAHLRETSVLDSTFQMQGDWRGVAASLGTEHSEVCYSHLEAMDDAVRRGSWSEARTSLEQAREAWDRAVEESVEELAHADSSFANRLRAAGLEGREADVVAYSMHGWEGRAEAERAAAKAAVVAYRESGEARSAVKRAREVGYLCGGEREWSSQTVSERAWGVVPAGTLVLMAGPAGSGKSTHATRLSERGGVKVVSTDGIRREILGDEADQSRGDEVFRERDRRVREALQRGETVLVDATNLDRSVGRLIGYAKQSGRDVCVLRMDTPPERVLSQNDQRARVVPGDAVERHLKRHAELDEGAWRKMGASVVMNISDAETIGEVPVDGCPLRPVTSTEIQNLVDLGVGEEAPGGGWILPIPYLARRGGKVQREGRSLAKPLENGGWSLHQR